MKVDSACCYDSMPAGIAGALLYSGSRDQLAIDQDREYISVNGKAAFSSLQTMLGRGRLGGVQVQYPAERSTSSH